jgi:hypothetical protein
MNPSHYLKFCYPALLLLAGASSALAAEAPFNPPAESSFDHYLTVLGTLLLFAYAFWPRCGQVCASAAPKQPFWKKLMPADQSCQSVNMVDINPNTTLARLSLPYKVLFTGFLLVIGVGLMMAGAQIMLTHGKADGKPGLSVNDIVYSYYGNRSGSKLESMLEGSMKAMAPDEARFELIQWARDEAPLEQWAPRIEPLLQKHCVACHNAESAQPDFTKLEVVKKLAEVDQGASIATLTRVSHIHLFGIGFIFLFVGWIFGMAEFDCRWKVILISTPFAFLILDVLSWWLTKYFPVFAWLTMIGGFGYSLASTAMIFTSLVQMWLPHWTARGQE